MKKQGWVSNVKLVSGRLSALRNSVLWKCALAVANLTVGIAAFTNPTLAQSNIVPDNTLGTEASRVIFNSRGTPNEAIEGGAQRGQNLFHSFQEFNVSQNRGAYFHVLDPSIQNIFARVTGTNRSDILGFLGTRQIINGNLFSSNANLFLMNPNGIVFGENARLDINGSFYTTTANEIRFGNQGNFSTINPQAPRALTVNPSALFFDAVAKQGEIVNRSIGGLEVLPGRTLGLVGGNILIEGGTLFASSGRIELGSVAPNSIVNITPQDTAYSLSYEGINNFQDIVLSQAALVGTSGNSGGAVQVQGRNIAVTGGSSINANVTGNGVGGGLTVNASESVQVIGENTQRNGISALRVQVSTAGTGKGGDMTINTPTLIVKDGAQISTGVFGAGEGGNLNVNASSKIKLTGTTVNGNFASGLFSETLVTGDAGNIEINTNELLIQDGARVNSSTRAFGQGGNINIGADTVDLIGQSANGIFRSALGSETTGINSNTNAGNVTLTTRILNIRDGALISTQTSNQGKGGNLTITARESINITGTGTFSNGQVTRSGLFTGTSGSGAAGNIKIFDTGLMQMQNGGQVLASTSGLGKGGTIDVTADKIDLEGISTNQQFPSGFGSETSGISSSANAGDVTLATRILNIRNGARISTESFNQGQAGNLTVSASESLNITGIGTQNNSTVPSGLFTSTRNSGTAGNLKIVNTGLLKVQDGGRVSTSTLGQGQGGNLEVNADTIEIIGIPNNQLFSSLLGSETTGISSSANAGNVTLTTRLLNIQDGGLISTQTFNQGRGGDLNVTARESINIAGTGTLSNGQVTRSGLITITSGSGAAGNLKIFDTGLVKIQDGGGIEASTFGQGRGGNIDVTADTVDLVGLSANGLLSSILGSQTTSFGSSANAGNVTLNTRLLNIRDGGLISTQTSNQGRGGDLNVTARESISVTGIATLSNSQSARSGLITITSGSSAAGNLKIFDTGLVKIQDGAGIEASTFGRGRGGNIDVTADTVDLVGLSANGLFSSILGSQTTGFGSSANAGNVTLTTKLLNIRDGALISTSTSNQGKGGNLTITAGESINVVGIGTLSNGRVIASGLFTTTSGTGAAGNLKIVDTGLVKIENGGAITASTFGQGRGGNIDVIADKLELEGVSTNELFLRSFLGSETTGISPNAKSGDVNLSTRILNVRDGALISTDAFNQGQGGNLTVTARESLNVLGTSTVTKNSFQLFYRSALSTQTRGFGAAGNLNITDTGEIVIADGAGIFASTSGQGNGGNIDISANSLDLKGLSTDGRYRSFLASETTGIDSNANAGNIKITTRILNVNDGALISTETSNQGRGGNLTISARESMNFIGTATLTNNRFARSALSTITQGSGEAGNLRIIDTGLIKIEEGAGVFASSIGQGKGGNINIAADSIDLAGVSSNREFPSFLGSETTGVNSTAEAGDVTITARNLNISNGAFISTQTSNRGKGGNLTVTARESLNIFGIGTLNSQVVSSGLFTETSGLGAAGNIKIFDTNRFVTALGGQVSTASSSLGQGGNIEINADTVELIGISDGNQRVSAFISETFGQNSIANAGDIKITSRILNIRDGARISTQTFNQGRGGNLNINARESLNIVGTGIQNQQVIGSGLLTRTASFGAAGNINIFNTELLTIKDGGQISASTFGQGQGGDIEVSAGNVEILGISSNGQFTSAIGSETAGANSSADAGDITLTAINLNIRDRGLISTNSFNQGKAGNININVDKTLNLTNGNILTFSRQSSGGSVNANAEEIRLFDDSNISTSVVSGTGGGGDIKLTANFILAFGDSDILAFAQDGKGGNITFDTPAFFGENYRPAPPGTNPLTLEENNRVDINASAAVSGVIVLPDTSFVRNNLDELPEDAINTNALIANSCIARRNQQNGSFFVTGSGGLPARPSDAPLPSYSTGDVQPVPTQESAKLPTQKRRWQIGDPVIEPSGVYELPNGKLVLGKEC